MKYKDNRAKLTSAVLSDIKILKMYAWEKSFMGKVWGIRAQELQALKRSQFLFSASLVSFSSSTFLVSSFARPNRTAPVVSAPFHWLPFHALQIAFIMFAVYVLVDETNVLNAQKAFVSLALVNILNTAHSFLPLSINAVVQVSY